MSTGEEAVQNDWEFYKDMDEYLKDDPSITAPVTSDSIHGVKHKMQRNDHEDNEVYIYSCYLFMINLLFISCNFYR
jgi:hypothetical protein